MTDWRNWRRGGSHNWEWSGEKGLWKKGGIKRKIENDFSFLFVNNLTRKLTQYRKY